MSRISATEAMRRRLAGLWTSGHIADRYGVTTMSVHNWRSRKRDPLPCVVLPGSGNHRRDVAYVPNDVRTWAKRNGKKQVRMVRMDHPALQMITVTL